MVFFFFKFADEKGMRSVLDGGPWVIRSMPLFLNVWSPVTKLRKDEIKEIAIWIKIHNVPLVAYSDDGLSLLASKLGTPKQLDAYTSSMCTEAWGRSSYARALVEISADSDFKKELTIGVPDVEGEGYHKEVMKVEYEWQPPRCSHCCVFGHWSEACPKQVRLEKKKAKVDDEGFTEVAGRKKGQNKTGFNVGKPKQRFEYRPVATQKGGKDAPSSSGTKIDHPVVTTKNSFDALSSNENSAATVPPVPDDNKATMDSDDEEVEEVYNETAEFMKMGSAGQQSEGASTPGSMGSNG